MTSISFCIATMNRIPELLCTLLRLKQEIVFLSKELHTVVRFEIIINDSSEDVNQVPISLIRSIFDNTSIDICLFSTLPCGIDRGYEETVNHAKGEYIWLLSDDDLIIKGSLETILKSIVLHMPTMIVVNGVLSSFNLLRDYKHTLFNIVEDSSLIIKNDIYDINTLCELYERIDNSPSYISFAIFRLDHWRANLQYSSLGSEFSHVTRLFGSIPFNFKAVILSTPCLKIRMNSSQWKSRSIAIWFINWPYVLAKCQGLSNQTWINNTGYNSIRFAISRFMVYKAYGIIDTITRSNNFGKLRFRFLVILLIYKYIIPEWFAKGFIYLIASKSKPWLAIDALI